MIERNYPPRAPMQQPSVNLLCHPYRDLPSACRTTRGLSLPGGAGSEFSKTAGPVLVVLSM